MDCRCRVEHELVVCVDCARDITHFRFAALDGRPRCGRCHVLAARARRRAAMK